MKKQIVILNILLVIALTGISQTAFYDAKNIAENFIKRNIDPFAFKTKRDTVHLLCAVLRNYLPDSIKNDPFLNDAMVLDNFKENPFIGDQIEVLTRGGATPPLTGVVSKSLTAVGGLDVTNFADGLAKFLVERVKQELSTSFFERFKNALDSNEQLGIMFPVTRNALKAIDKEIYNYSAYLDLLRDSFQKDLVLLLPHIDKLIKDKSMDVIFSKYPEVRVMLSHAFYIVNEFSKGEFPGEVYHNYVIYRAMNDSLKLDSINNYLWPSLATLDLFSQSLRSRQPDQYWISSDSLQLLFDDITFQIYIGLIYQQVLKTPIYFTDKISFASLLKEYGQKVFALKILYEPYLTGLLEKGKSIDFYYESINDKQKTGHDKPTYQDYFSLYDASVNFMEYVSQAPFLDTLLLKDNLPNLEDYFRSARSMGNIYVDIYEKQYTSAIVEFTGILQILLNEKIKLQIDFNKASMKGADPLVQQALKQTNGKLEEILEANALILKYGSLAASIAKAETSEDVNNAIEAAALPAGSSRIKRETPFNVSLNAFTGLFMGYEKITGFDDKIAVNSYGLAAPVGVAISSGQHKFLGMPCKRGGHWSYSAFVSFIDIGTIAAFRFQNDSVDQVPTIKLQDIFSPGLFFSVGIPKCPLSVNMGAQVGPNLRKVNVEDENGDMVNKYQDNVYWRFSVSVVVDIPIFNFYTKSR